MVYYQLKEFSAITESVIRYWHDYLLFLGETANLRNIVATETRTREQFTTVQLDWSRPFSKHEQYKYIHIAINPNLYIVANGGNDHACLFKTSNGELDNIVSNKEAIIREVVELIKTLDTVSANAMNNIDQLVA